MGLSDDVGSVRTSRVRSQVLHLADARADAPSTIIASFETIDIPTRREDDPRPGPGRIDSQKVTLNICRTVVDVDLRIHGDMLVKSVWRMGVPVEVAPQLIVADEGEPHARVDPSLHHVLSVRSETIDEPIPMAVVQGVPVPVEGGHDGLLIQKALQLSS